MNFADWEALIDSDPDEAVRSASKKLDADPDDVLALFVIATVNSRAERFGLASILFRKCCDIRPERPESWNNLGMCYSGLGLNLKARQAFNEAWKRKKSAMFASNIGMTHYSERDMQKAIDWCLKALEIEPESKAAKSTLGLAYLALGNWEHAWEYNGNSVGGKFRRDIQYGDEPVWDGSPGKTVVFYGEQGIGDEIMYSSVIPDAVRDCDVVLECDKRLAGLMRRSFGGAHVYGTRNKTEVEWLAHHKIEARLPIGQLPQFYRKTPKACPGTPYLVADPERRVQWRALFDSWGSRPKIGLCWTGGSKFNKPKERAIGLESMRQLIESIDADWISLQYKDPTAEIEASGLPVRYFKRACETDDYDDTAGLVAELDCVIGVHTSVQHLAGALGVRGVVLVPYKSLWIYDLPDGSMPWYASASLFRQREGEPWKSTIGRLLNEHPFIRGLRSSGGGSIPHVHAVGASHSVPPGRLHPVVAAFA